MPGQRARQMAVVKDDKTSYEAVQAFTEHHIVAVRKRRSGEITQVKHAVYGWMSVKDYYGLQKVHDFFESPLFGQAVLAGYTLKSWVWGSSIDLDILASGFTLPTWVILGALITAEVAVDTQTISQLHAKIAVLNQDITALQQLQQANINILGTGSTLQADYAADIASDQQEIGSLNGQIQNLKLNVFLLAAAVVLPFGEIYLFFHYANLIYQWLTGGIKDVTTLVTDWLEGLPLGPLGEILSVIDPTLYQNILAAVPTYIEQGWNFFTSGL